MKLPTEVICLMYAKNLTRLDIEVTKNDKLLDKLTELVVDNNHLKRQNRLMSQMILDKNKEIESLNLELYEQEATIKQTEEQLHAMTVEFNTQSIELQKALASYSQHI